MNIAADLIAKAIIAFITCCGMNADNENRESRGEAPAYTGIDYGYLAQDLENEISRLKIQNIRNRLKEK